MIIYRDQNNNPTHVAWLIASDYNNVYHWLQDHKGYTLGPDIIKTERAYLDEIAGYLRGRHLNGISDDSGINLPYWYVWHCCELIAAENNNET
jgi:hypothetical protein